MCGIIACRTHAPVIDYLLIALRRLEYRGYDSVGVAVQTTGGKVVRLRTLGRIGALEREVREWAGPGLTGVPMNWQAPTNQDTTTLRLGRVAAAQRSDLRKV